MNDKRDKAMEDLKKSSEVKTTNKEENKATNLQIAKARTANPDEDEDINKNKSEAQRRPDQVNKDLFEKEESERIAKAEKEVKEKEVREQLLKDIINKMMEINKMEKEIAAQKEEKAKSEVIDPEGGNKEEVKKAEEAIKEKALPKVEGVDPENKDKALPKKGEKEKALEEAKKELQEMISGKTALEALKDIKNEINSKSEALDKKIEYLTQKYEKEIADAKATKDEALLQEVLKNIKVETDGFIATAMKIEFGASISDILMKGSDIGLHAGNVLLGVPDKDGKIDKSAQINSTKTLLNMAEGKLKIQTMNKKMKEFEISQLEKLKIAGGQVDDREIDRLKVEVSELEDQLFQSQNSVKKVEAEMTSLKDG
jgi:hypothetical protein